MPARKASKRELIDTGSDKRYVRRDKEGKFKESDDQGRSLAQDVKKKLKPKLNLVREIRATKSVSSFDE